MSRHRPSVARSAVATLAFVAACVVQIGRGPAAQTPAGQTPVAERPAGRASPARPLLVTVDDLPLAGAASRGDAAARRATTEALPPS